MKDKYDSTRMEPLSPLKRPSHLSEEDSVLAAIAALADSEEDVVPVEDATALGKFESLLFMIPNI